MRIDEENAKVLKAAGYDVKKSMAGDENAVDSYDIAEDLNTTDEERMPVRSVRLGDARVMPNKVTFLPPQTRTYQTAGDMAVPRDSFLSPNLTEEASVTPPQAYRCEYPDGQKLHEENFLAQGESEGVKPADFVAPSPSNILKRAPMFANLIRGFTNGENGS